MEDIRSTMLCNALKVRRRILKSMRYLMGSQLLEDRGDVFDRWSSGDDPGNCVLDQFEFMEEFEWETGEERVAIINTEDDVCVDKYSWAVP